MFLAGLERGLNNKCLLGINISATVGNKYISGG